MPSDALKTCSKCLKDKPLNRFSFQSYIRKDGTRTYKTVCKDCLNTYSQKYYKRHKKEHLMRGRNWNTRNRERRRELSRIRYRKDPETRIKRQVEYNRKRNALKVTGHCDTGITLDIIYARDKGICQLCNKPCMRCDASIDHRIPLSLKGTHTWDNVQLAHFNCNAQKGNRVCSQ